MLAEVARLYNDWKIEQNNAAQVAKDKRNDDAVDAAGGVRNGNAAGGGDGQGQHGAVDSKAGLPPSGQGGT